MTDVEELDMATAERQHAHEQVFQMPHCGFRIPRKLFSNLQLAPGLQETAVEAMFLEELEEDSPSAEDC